ncbi:MAG TPA: DUF4335 domain-containing protein [Trichormus sp. M33_DOE_039]|nr:DUF4335 domain-containing protein [Trichormus sp. M33_DOE_039]
MPLSNSVIRRYTPPTCTLEVLAQNSPLSRWMGKPVLKQLTFELHFDDPALPEERRVPIRGDRDQLEALCDAVTSYVQELLQQSPESFWFSFSGIQDSTKVSHDTELTDFPADPLLATTSHNLTSSIPGSKIYLESHNYLTHNLYLGSLANHTSGAVIQLSLLQLFDLATALDEYATDVLALPTLNQNSSVVRFPTWVTVAAMFVIAVGLTPLTWQYANNMRTKEAQTAKTADSPDTQVALQAPPAPNFPLPQAELTPPNSSALLPLPSTPPLPSSNGLPINTLPSPGANLSTTNTNSALTPNSVTSKRAADSPQIQIPSVSGNSSVNIPDQQIAIQPNPSVASNSAELGLPIKRDLPPRLSSTPAPLPPPLATLPNATRSNPIPRLYSPITPDQSQARISSSATTPSNVADTSSLGRRLRGESNNPTPTEVSVNSSGTLFDTPQVAEAREFLKKRWQPPTGFAQTLEYSVMVGVDGSVERIDPLGKAARENFDMVGMPAIGEPFVSANRYGKNMRIRVVLSPDGKVQTFPESE